MIDRLFSSNTQQILEQALRASGLTHEVIAHNLANVDTPGFKRSEVIFQEKLRAALAAAQEADQQPTGIRTHPWHLPIGEVLAPGSIRPEVVVRAETSLRPDGNNVDLDAEMVKLNQNTLLYQTLAQLISGKLAQLRSVITEGRR